MARPASTPARRPSSTASSPRRGGRPSAPHPRRTATRRDSVSGIGYASRPEPLPGECRGEGGRRRPLPVEPADGGGGLGGPLSSPRRWRSKNASISGSQPSVGPGSALSGRPWPHGPVTSRRSGDAVQRSCIRNAGSTYESFQPVYGEDRHLDPPVVRGQRALAVVRAVGLVAEPLQGPRRGRLEPGQPLLAPGRAAEGRVGRHRVHRDLAHRVLRLLADRQAAAPVVDVVAVAIVGGHDRDDRPQVGRPQRGDLDRREPAVADAPHRRRRRCTRAGRRATRRPRSRPGSRRRCTRRGRRPRCCRCPGRRAGTGRSRAPPATRRGRRRRCAASCPCRTGSSRGWPGSAPRARPSRRPSTAAPGSRCWPTARSRRGSGCARPRRADAGRRGGAVVRAVAPRV